MTVIWHLEINDSSVHESSVKFWNSLRICCNIWHIFKSHLKSAFSCETDWSLCIALYIINNAVCPQLYTATFSQLATSSNYLRSFVTVLLNGSYSLSSTLWIPFSSMIVLVCKQDYMTMHVRIEWGDPIWLCIWLYSSDDFIEMIKDDQPRDQQDQSRSRCSAPVANQSTGILLS